MKVLSKFEIAAVRRTYQTVKPFNAKVAKLEEKISAMQAEVDLYKETISQYDAPIKTLTGISSIEYMSYLEAGLSPEEIFNKVSQAYSQKEIAEGENYYWDNSSIISEDKEEVIEEKVAEEKVEEKLTSEENEFPY